jgi:hypothetical protein
MLDSHGDGAEELKDVVFVNGLGLLPALALDNLESGRAATASASSSWRAFRSRLDFSSSDA